MQHDSEFNDSQLMACSSRQLTIIRCKGNHNKCVINFTSYSLCAESDLVTITKGVIINVQPRY
jgi:hypothetical protein